MKSSRLLIVLALSVLFVAFVLAANNHVAPAASADVEIGVAPLGETATEFVGRADQDGGSFVSYGYLTHIAGFTDTLLFSQFPTTTESTAHFTYFATSTLTGHFVITGAANGLASSIFVVDSVGMTTYYYNPTPSATFNISTSFTGGTPILTATVRYHDILNVQSANFGVATGAGEMIDLANSPFTIGPTTYRLGRVGLQERSSTMGQGIRTNAVIPQSFVVLAGSSIVTGLPGQLSYLPYVSHNATGSP
jgi:hypothetical protein